MGTTWYRWVEIYGTRWYRRQVPSYRLMPERSDYGETVSGETASGRSRGDAGSASDSGSGVFRVHGKWLCRDINTRNCHTGEIVQTGALCAVWQQKRHTHYLHP